MNTFAPPNYNPFPNTNPNPTNQTGGAFQPANNNWGQPVNNNWGQPAVNTYPNPNPQGNMGMGQPNNYGTGYGGGMGMGAPGGYTGAPLLPNQQVRVQYKIEELRRNLQSPDFTNSIPEIVALHQKDLATQIEDCTKIEEVNQLEQGYLSQVRQRCLKIKSKNQQIMIEILNIKQKISRSSSLTANRNLQDQQKLNNIHEQIRRVGMDISNKLNSLRSKRIHDRTFNPNINKNNNNNGNNNNRNRNGGTIHPINIALTELKDKTEVINRDLIEQREQIRVLIRELYREDI